MKKIIVGIICLSFVLSANASSKRPCKFTGDFNSRISEALNKSGFVITEHASDADYAFVGLESSIRSSFALLDLEKSKFVAKTRNKSCFLNNSDNCNGDLDYDYIIRQMIKTMSKVTCSKD